MFKGDEVDGLDEGDRGVERLEFNMERLGCAWLDPTICPTFDVAVDDSPASDVACLE